MADVSAPAVQVASPKKKVVKGKGGAAKPSHPKTADLVLEAVTKLNEKGGSSLQAIKKYLADVHKVDVGRMGTFIIKAIKNLTINGKLTQTKGKGASGSFKLAVKPKVAAPKKVKKSPSKKVSPKKVATKKPAKPKAAAVKKSPAKKTTTKKVAAKKPKASEPAPPPPTEIPAPVVESKKAPAKAKKPAAVKKTKTVTKVKLPKTLKKTSPMPSSPKKSAPKKK